ncbi:hypothetical protein HDU80_002380 [Chytriomyces hyalinus]|nr:hypothetical protein HDU80_002380 [Chytriomyces hyalinus]
MQGDFNHKVGGTSDRIIMTAKGAYFKKDDQGSPHQYSMYVKYCMSHPDETHTSPYKLWYRVEPNLSKLQPFGCKVTTLVHKDKQNPPMLQEAHLESSLVTTGTPYTGYAKISMWYHAQTWYSMLTQFPGTHTSGEISDQTDGTDGTEDMGETSSTLRYNLRPRAGPSAPTQEPSSEPPEISDHAEDYPADFNDIPSEDKSTFSDLESEFSDIQPDQYLVPERVVNGYMSDKETQTPVYLSVETKTALYKWGIKNIVMSKVVAQNQPTRKQVHTPDTGTVGKLLNKYPNPVDTPP